MSAPSLRDLLNQEQYREDLPLFAGMELLESRAAETQPLVAQSVLEALPDRFRKAAEEAVSLYRFFEKKQSVNYAPAFTAVLGAVDEAARALILQKLTPKMPANMQAQKDWFEPYLGKVDPRMHRHYEELARNLRKTIVYKDGVSPLGLLRNCLDYSLNDKSRLTGVFDAAREAFRFQGARDVLDKVKFINEFRNTRVAHQEQPINDANDARSALIKWIEGLRGLGSAGRNQSSTIKEHQIVQLRSAVPEEGLKAGDTGTVVHVYRDAAAFEVEFVAEQGSKVVTLSPEQIRAAN
jgi:type III restriction enzyme